MVYPTTVVISQSWGKAMVSCKRGLIYCCLLTTEGKSGFQVLQIGKVGVDLNDKGMARDQKRRSYKVQKKKGGGSLLGVVRGTKLAVGGWKRNLPEVWGGSRRRIQHGKRKPAPRFCGAGRTFLGKVLKHKE